MYAAVDIGGTKTLVAVFGEKGKVTEQVKFPTPPDYDDFIIELEKAVDSLSEHEFKTATVAIPGKVDREHGVGIVFGNLPWENVPVAKNAEKIFKCPVVIENDANLAGLSEARAEPDYQKVLYVTVSTGIGGGFVIDGIISPLFADAEIGHILLEHDGQLRRWEDFASGRAIYEKYGKKAADIDDDATWYVISRNIALGLIDLIATLTPDLIVIGGGVGSHFQKYGDRLREQLKIYENPMLQVPPIIQAKNAEEAVIYGCYEYAKDAYKKNH